MTPLFALLFESLDERLRLRKPGRKVLNKVFPDNWSFLLGEVALFSFVLLVLTGVLLTMFYRPSTDPVTYQGAMSLYEGRELPAAFESIVRMSYDVPGGLFFRRVHRGASHLFIATTVLHMLRVLLTGAFRRPREVNYHVGIVLLMLTFAAGFTGYSLPYDALAGTGIRIAYSSLLSLPYVGEQVAYWIFGGDFPTGNMIPRFFVFHVLMIPALLVGLITVHLMIMVRQRHTQFPRPGIDGHRFVLGKPMWPSQFALSTTLILWIAGLLSAAAVLIPWSDVLLIGPYVPGEVGNNAQPDWFLFWLEGALRVFPPLEFRMLGMTVSGAFVAGVVLPGAIFAVLVAYPFVERRFYQLEGDWHVLQNPLEIPLRAAVSVGTFSFVLLLSAAATNDILSRMTGIPIEAITWFFRLTCAFVPPALAAGFWVYSTRRLARKNMTVPRNEAEASNTYAAKAREA
ncbi:MAG TPA: cytochrome b N-terminal domain-containing protein [Egibacteraceae bacterium]|jgi:ubiquinol-cytochrome c reductase cytochrome b subunit|nr:cytochrome b N-terminal domain-containing protein [Egibacteraceae bacterium]